MAHSPFPMRRITSGPKHHWFGYYDKLQFDPSCRYALGMAVDFEHRSPAAGDAIEVGMIDLADGDRWTALGTTSAWCWQQGCMLQWRPGYGYAGASHFIWRDSRTILAWSFHPGHGSRFHLYRDRCDGDPAVIGDGVMGGNGHCSYLPGSRWILNDTYPGKEDRLQALYLFHPETGRRVDLGSFPSPEQYSGEWRCDLHPRSSPDGRSITFDSAHEGSGRQIYWMNIAEAVG